MVVLPKHNIVPRVITGLYIVFHDTRGMDFYFTRPDEEVVFIPQEISPGVLDAISFCESTEVTVPLLSWGQLSFQGLVLRMAARLQKKCVHLVSWKGRHGALLCNGATNINFR